MRKERIADWDALEDRRPAHALVANVDLVVVRFDDEVSVLYGRCQHRGALMADGFIRGDALERALIDSRPMQRLRSTIGGISFAQACFR